MTMACLSMLQEVDLKKYCVTLPRICQWYHSDFGTGTTEDCLRLVATFLINHKKDTLERMLRQLPDKLISVKFHPFRWGCRRLQLLRTDKIEALTTQS
mmetsp:Transcript_10105/g.38308  ORF Transcript_10105/g.38308 Transcript_10105/m.38308 type:complete len:98 (+) Transcript_10105:605-898(+)